MSAIQANDRHLQRQQQQQVRWLTNQRLAKLSEWNPLADWLTRSTELNGQPIRRRSDGQLATEQTGGHENRLLRG